IFRQLTHVTPVKSKNTGRFALRAAAIPDSQSSVINGGYSRGGKNVSINSPTSPKLLNVPVYPAKSTARIPAITTKIDANAMRDGPNFLIGVSCGKRITPVMYATVASDSRIHAPTNT